jgi:hypothetical protein
MTEKTGEQMQVEIAQSTALEALEKAMEARRNSALALSLASPALLAVLVLAVSQIR